MLAGVVIPLTCLALRGSQELSEVLATATYTALGIPFRSKEMLLEGLDLLSMVKRVETPLGEDEQQVLAIRALHRRAETGAASAGWKAVSSLDKNPKIPTSHRTQGSRGGLSRGRRLVHPWACRQDKRDWGCSSAEAEVWSFLVASALAGRLGGEILNRKFSDHRSQSFGR